MAQRAPPPSPSIPELNDIVFKKCWKKLFGLRLLHYEAHPRPRVLNSQRSRVTATKWDGECLINICIVLTSTIINKRILYQQLHFPHCHHNQYNFHYFNYWQHLLLQFTQSNRKHFLQDQLKKAFRKEGVNLDMDQFDCTKMPSEMEVPPPQKMLTLLNDAYTINTVYTAFTAFTDYCVYFRLIVSSNSTKSVIVTIGLMTMTKSVRSFGHTTLLLFYHFM